MKVMEKRQKQNIVFYSALLLFSTIVVFLCIRWNLPIDKTTVSYSYVRVELMEDFMETIRSGEIPQFLSAYEHSYGYALYLPYIGVLFGIQEGWQLLLWVQLGAMAILILVLPFLMYMIFKNKIVAFMTPILLHLFCGNILYGFKTDSFWGMAWVIMLTMPLIFMLSEPGWRRKKTVLVVVIAIICSVGNVMRNHNGFVPMILVLGILFYKFVRKEIKLLHFLLLCAVFYLCYESISTFLPLFVGACLGLPTLDNEAFMWHAILCGWGYYPNEYGLLCNDEVISQVVSQHYPYEIYATDEYANSCKQLVLEILIKNPLFVISTYALKFVEMMKFIIKYVFLNSGNDYYYFNTGIYTIRNIFVPSLLAIIIAIGSLFKEKGKETFKKYGIIMVFCIVGVIAGTVEAVMMLPELKYGLASVISISMIPFYLSLIGLHIFTETKH